MTFIINALLVNYVGYVKVAIILWRKIKYQCNYNWITWNFVLNLVNSRGFFNKSSWCRFHKSRYMLITKGAQHGLKGQYVLVPTDLKYVQTNFTNIMWWGVLDLKVSFRACNLITKSKTRSLNIVGIRRKSIYEIVLMYLFKTDISI